MNIPGAGTGGLDRWSVTGMALLLFIALLALLCSSIRAKLRRREHERDRLPDGPRAKHATTVSMVQADGARRVPRSTLDSSRLP